MCRAKQQKKWLQSELSRNEMRPCMSSCCFFICFVTSFVVCCFPTLSLGVHESERATEPIIRFFFYYVYWDVCTHGCGRSSAHEPNHFIQLGCSRVALSVCDCVCVEYFLLLFCDLFINVTTTSAPFKVHNVHICIQSIHIEHFILLITMRNANLKANKKNWPKCQRKIYTKKNVSNFSEFAVSNSFIWLTRTDSRIFYES